MFIEVCARFVGAAGSLFQFSVSLNRKSFKSFPGPRILEIWDRESPLRRRIFLDSSHTSLAVGRERGSACNMLSTSCTIDSVRALDSFDLRSERSCICCMACRTSEPSWKQADTPLSSLGFFCCWCPQSSRTRSFSYPARPSDPKIAHTAASEKTQPRDQMSMAWETGFCFALP